MSYSDSMKVIQSLSQNVETLASLGAICGVQKGEELSNDLIAARLKAVQHAAEPSFLQDLTAEELQFLHSTIRANLRRALELTEDPGRYSGWGFEDPLILQAQGKASRVVADLISEFAERTNSLREKLNSNACFLDIGSGVGWISITMAERWPSLLVRGIDIHKPALELAEENCSGSSASQRIEFFQRNVIEIDESDRYSAIFIPIVFIPKLVVQEALPLLFRSLVPGGWVFVASFKVPVEPLAKALNDLRTTLWGGKVWTEQDAISLMSHCGFEAIEDFGADTSLHLFAAQKPEQST